VILAFIQHIETAHVLVQNAYTLASGLKKTVSLLYFVEKVDLIPKFESDIQNLLASLHIVDAKISVSCGFLSDLQGHCDNLDASFLLLQSIEERNKSILKLLRACRELRIPYLLHKNDFVKFDLTKIILPVGFLEEEMEKTQFAAAFGRFFNAEVLMLLANDYGSKAATNAEKMKSFFSKFSFQYSLQKAKSDSFSVEKESVKIALEEKAGLIVVSASREYGLDDLIFGPNELQVVKKSMVPVLLVNPRGDLYALCD
jgi:nucleotide-binding universal stress UspA family protein